MSIGLGKDFVELGEILSQNISYCEVDKCPAVIKLKKCLQEIKEITEKAREDLYTCESIIYADDDLREILQKISECCE